MICVHTLYPENWPDVYLKVKETRMETEIGKEEGMEAKVTERNHCLKSTTPAHI